MTERDLNRLKSLDVPPPRGEAKRAAIDAAMAAFENAHPAGFASAESDAPVKDSPAGCAGLSETPSQGNVVPLRQTETSTPKRSFRMYLSSRSSQAMAASVAALVIAAPFAFQHLTTLRDAQPLTHVQTALKAPAQTATATPPAKVAQHDAGVADALRERFADDAKKKTDARAESVTIAEPAPAAAPTSSADVLREQSMAAMSPPAPPSEPKIAMPSGLGMGGVTGGAKHNSYAGLQQYQAERRLRGDIADAEKSNPQAWLGRSDKITSVTPEQNRDQFDARESNPVKQVTTEPVSTFSIDVDTASYAFARRALNAGRLPPKGSVRVEEMINYFPYAYPAPESVDVPFKPTITVMPSPWNANNKLVHVAIKGYDLKAAERPRANLVFLIDVSGSMAGPDRLDLIKNAFHMLVEQLKADDTIAIVTYASGSGIALEPTKAAEKWRIHAAIDQLGAGGSTAGAAGIADAYRLAEVGFDKNAINRVILATDGDFNVGITDKEQLKSTIAGKRQSGIFLSILGVGEGNHNDALMQTLAQNGNGTAAYVDTLNEARKVLVDEASSTLFTIAKDVKAQIEWNPQRIAEYRLIGYETRALRREDFNNDRVDAGDIGSGHTVTAIYEVTPVGAPMMADDLRYEKAVAATTDPIKREPVASPPTSTELGFLKLRYKRPNEDASQLITLPVTDAMVKSTLTEVPVEQRFSIAVAAFAQMLKAESYTQSYAFDDVLALAQSARGDDPFGYRAEFLNLVRLAKTAKP